MLLYNWLGAALRRPGGKWKQSEGAANANSTSRRDTFWAVLKKPKFEGHSNWKLENEYAGINTETQHIAPYLKTEKPDADFSYH